MSPDLDEQLDDELDDAGAGDRLAPSFEDASTEDAATGDDAETFEPWVVEGFDTGIPTGAVVAEAFVAEAFVATPPAEPDLPEADVPPDASDPGEATRQVDVTALFDAEAPEPVAADAWSPSPTSAYEPELAVSTTETPRRDSTFDMLSPDALDADVLDDDAFFATLREAVHDDTPLGPRDDDDADAFDESGERGSFRDVFRRRR